MAQIVIQKENNWDYQLYFKPTWVDHVKKVNSGLFEGFVQHGIPRSYKCCCSRTFMMEVCNRK